MKKLCLKCLTLKAPEDFCQDKSRKDGLNNRCRECDRQCVKSYSRRLGVREKYNARKVIYNKTTKARKYRRDYENQKTRTNPMFRLTRRIASAIRLSLHGNKAGRKWQKLTGYTVAELKGHLEKQFQSGMTWDNYGEWHIDHIIPISAFNFTKPEDVDFKQCWALENLQPLWAQENLRKSNKILDTSICESKLAG